MILRVRPRFLSTRVYLVALILLGLAAGWVAANPANLYLRIRSAPLRSKPAFKEGEEKGTVYLGQSFEVLERSKDGDWVKVHGSREAAEAAPKKEEAKTPEKKLETFEGWMHATVLAERAPEKERATHQSWLKEGAQALPESGRDPEALRLTKAAGFARFRKLDLKPVQSMERQYPKAAEVEEFLRAGQLGLYRPDWPSLEEGVQP